jgi:hypothetical protein
MYLCRKINDMDYYKDNSNPLIKVNLMELEPGHIYVDEQGHRFLYGEGTNGQPSMDVIQYSELSQGVMLDDLIYSENRESHLEIFRKLDKINETQSLILQELGKIK